MQEEYKMLTIKIDVELHKRLKMLAISEGLTMRDLVSKIFINKLKEEGIR